MIQVARFHIEYVPCWKNAIYTLSGTDDGTVTHFGLNRVSSPEFGRSDEVDCIWIGFLSGFWAVDEMGNPTDVKPSLYLWYFPWGKLLGVDAKRCAGETTKQFECPVGKMDGGCDVIFNIHDSLFPVGGRSIGI
jgi:hypothetical protein